MLRDTRLTGRKYRLKSLVLVLDRRMKEPWCLATNRESPAQEIVGTYGRRFTCEEQFRDEKDERFGAGSKNIRVGTAARRDMLTLIHAPATVLLTLLGEAGERLGYDKRLRANTVAQRTHSLYRQGKEYIKGIHRSYAQPVHDAFEALLRGLSQVTETYGVV